MAKISALTDIQHCGRREMVRLRRVRHGQRRPALSIAANFTGLATVTADWDATGSSIFVEVVNGGWLQLTNGADDRAMVFADVNDTSLFLQTYQAGFSRIGRNRLQHDHSPVVAPEDGCRGHERVPRHGPGWGDVDAAPHARNHPDRQLRHDDLVSLQVGGSNP